MGKKDLKLKVDDFMKQEHGVETPLGKEPFFKVQLYKWEQDKYVMEAGSAGHGHTKRVFMGFEKIDPDGEA